MHLPDSIDNLASLTDPADCRLGENEVHVWYCRYDPSADAPLGARYDALMTAEERARGERFRFERDRLQHQMTRALVRTTLSRYADVAPDAWRFGAGERGKPFVSGPAAAPRLAFNLSNTHGLIACAVSRSFDDIGIDVEHRQRVAEMRRLAEAHFAPPEVSAIRGESEEQVAERFFAYWTLKESYIKARGLGLAIPLEQFWFQLDDPAGVRIEMDERLGDEPADWWFGRYSLVDDYRMALAVRCSARQRPSLRAVSTVPLA